MKVIILSEAEDYCEEHNFQTISLKQLRDMAREDKPSGLEIEFKAGYGQCLNDLIKFVREKRP